MNKGQISLEFLVVLFAMIAILVIFMPVFAKLFNSSLLMIDVYNCSKKIHEFRANVSLLNTLENESSFEMFFDFLYPVILECKNKEVRFIISANTLEKELFLPLDLDCDFSEIVNNKNILVKKNDDLNISIN
jgi:hypothetical protein